MHYPKERPTITFEVRTYDIFGDAIDVEVFDTLELAKIYYDKSELKNEVVGKELEKHTVRYTPRISEYKTICSAGKINDPEDFDNSEDIFIVLP